MGKHVILSLSKEKKDIGACILGVLEGLGGIILLFSGVQRFLTDIMATYLAIICGILSIIVSIIAFTHPISTMFSVGYMIAFSVLMQGVNMIVLAVNFGKASEE